MVSFVVGIGRWNGGRALLGGVDKLILHDPFFALLFLNIKNLLKPIFAAIFG
jgi:hypothetical protein